MKQELSILTASIDPETGLIWIGLVLDGHKEVHLLAKPSVTGSAIRHLAEALAKKAATAPHDDGA